MDTIEESINGCMDQVDVVFINTIGYSSAIIKKEILPSVTTRMDLESIMVSEVSHSEDKYHMISLLWGILKQKRWAHQLVVSRGETGMGWVRRVKEEKVLNNKIMWIYCTA